MSSNASTAGSMDESKFLKRNRALHLTRLGLSALITTGAIAVIACEAQPLHHYKTTAQWESAGLALWPLNLDVRPTIAGLACGCVIAALSLVYMVVALLPSVGIPAPNTPKITANTYPATLPYQASQLICFRIGLLRVYHISRWHCLYHLSAVRILSERLQQGRDSAQLDMQMGHPEWIHFHSCPLCSRLPRDSCWVCDAVRSARI